MARFFDAKAALAQIRSNPIHAIHPTSEELSARNRTNRVNRVPPDVEIFEERAAIIEFDGGLARAEAEALADLFVRTAWTRDYLRRCGAVPAGPLPDADPVDHPAVAVAPFPGREAARTG